MRGGCLAFDPWLLPRQAFTTTRRMAIRIAQDGRPVHERVPAGALAFTLCQTPVIYRLARRPAICIVSTDGRTTERVGTRCDARTTRAVLDRDGTIRRIEVHVVLPPPASH